LVLVATVCDLRRRLIPDWIAVALVAWAVTATAFGLNAVGWWSLLGGFAVALLLGVVLFALGGLGGGDVKLLAGLGAALGLFAFFGLLFWVAIAGGILALVAACRGQRELAYVPAMALGFALFLLARGEVAHALAL
jgi:prepilin peptidase CpaA